MCKYFDFYVVRIYLTSGRKTELTFRKKGVREKQVFTILLQTFIL